MKEKNEPQIRIVTLNERSTSKKFGNKAEDYTGYDTFHSSCPSFCTPQTPVPPCKCDDYQTPVPPCKCDDHQTPSPPCSDCLTMPQKDKVQPRTFFKKGPYSS